MFTSAFKERWPYLLKKSSPQYYAFEVRSVIRPEKVGGGGLHQFYIPCLERQYERSTIGTSGHTLQDCLSPGQVIFYHNFQKRKPVRGGLLHSFMVLGYCRKFDRHVSEINIVAHWLRFDHNRFSQASSLYSFPLE